MTPLSQDSAEVLATEALAWLVGNEDLLPTFLAATGAAGAELRDRARDAEFLASVLDFLLMDDAWIVAFCESSNYAYDFPLRARAALPGGSRVDWT